MAGEGLTRAVKSGHSVAVSLRKSSLCRVYANMEVKRSMLRPYHGHAFR